MVTASYNGRSVYRNVLNWIFLFLKFFITIIIIWDEMAFSLCSLLAHKISFSCDLYFGSNIHILGHASTYYKRFFYSTFAALKLVFVDVSSRNFNVSIDIHHPIYFTLIIMSTNIILSMPMTQYTTSSICMSHNIIDKFFRISYGYDPRPAAIIKSLTLITQICV